MACSTPIALIIFNRPDLTRQVFEAVRRARPSQLYVVADGPRTPEETTKCQATRAIFEKVDWPCAVHRQYSEVNLGCGRRPATGIDWVFSQVEEAIILEDDCVPAPSFFGFCERLLEHYRHDTRIMHISGDNYLLDCPPRSHSYYFSKYTLSCGWATWRRAWRHYDYGIKSWPQFSAGGLLHSVFPDPIEAKHWARRLEPIYKQERDDVWDFQWNYAVWTHGGLAVLPSVNLIRNLGFREDGTHTRKCSPWADLPVGEIAELSHPPFVVPDREADLFVFDEFYQGKRKRQKWNLKYLLGKPRRILSDWGALPS